MTTLYDLLIEDRDPVAEPGSHRHVWRLVARLDEANAAVHGGLIDASRHTRIRQLVGRTVDGPLVFQALRNFRPDELARSSPSTISSATP